MLTTDDANPTLDMINRFSSVAGEESEHSAEYMLASVELMIGKIRSSSLKVIRQRHHPCHAASQKIQNTILDVQLKQLMNMAREIQVRVRDLQESAEISQVLDSYKGKEPYDLVALAHGDVGVITNVGPQWNGEAYLSDISFRSHNRITTNSSIFVTHARAVRKLTPGLSAMTPGLNPVTLGINTLEYNHNSMTPGFVCKLPWVV
ncbi:unnamed protein product [Peronospora farinosa]|uniref:Uncharacterized protein n=1 Tax=Peronospora farinosa TaxID=134698 RepID=A0AAV0UJ24_9STRA|nr:unnamed protein product [Peronospora farinosa]